jgi:hypothetical protein
MTKAGIAEEDRERLGLGCMLVCMACIAILVLVATGGAEAPSMGPSPAAEEVPIVGVVQSVGDKREYDLFTLPMGLQAADPGQPLAPDLPAPPHPPGTVGDAGLGP